MTDSELITKIGLALYGEYWRTDMAKVRDVRRHSIDEWSRGQGAPVPAGVWAELAGDVAARLSELDELSKLLAAKAGKG